MRRITRGFTIIELLVVVSVIGILATISLVGFNRYQADSRDAQRSSQATILAEALEKYYDKNGEYPSCNAMTDIASNVVDNTLVGTNPEVLVAPQAASDQTNSIDFCTSITPSTPTDSFAYVGDGTSTCSTGDACLQYTLQYKEESTNTIKTITSRRQTSVCTSGDITNLSATTFSFAQVNLSWTAIGGATTYNIESATNATFTTGLAQTTSSTNSASVTGLTLGTLYYFRVQPASATASCNWSNTSSATTYTLDTPDGAAVPDPAAPASQLKLTWSPITNATSYTVDYNSTGDVDGTGRLTSPISTTGTSPFVVSGLSAGSTRYFKIRANASGYTSGWSATDSATTTVPVPTGLTATTNSSTQITANWNTVSVATSYSLEYSTDSNFVSPAPTTTLTSTSGRINSIAGISQAVTGLQQGTTLYFRVYALVGATSSLASSSANATTTVNAPTGVSVSANDTGSVRAYAAGDWIQWNDSPAAGNWYYAWGTGSGSCPSGTTRQFRFGANYTSPTTFLGWTGWETTATKYRVSPNSGYGVRFHVEARCVGSAGNVSSSVGSTSGYAY